MIKELIDAKGFRVKVPENIRGIISLSPAVTEILFDLGLDDSIVGVTPYCVRPDKAREKKKVGSYGYVNTELLDNMKPDLILTVTGYQDKLVERLREKFNVFSFELPSTLSGILDLVVKVGLVTGKSEEARNIESQLIERLNKLNKFNGESVYIELDLGGPVTFGALSYITDSLFFMGLDPIYKKEIKEWIIPDFEYIKNINPYFIIFEPKMFSRRDGNTIERIIKDRNWENIDAHLGKRIFVTPGNYDFFAHHGPSFIREVLPWLASKVPK